jgi:hypothetical protein
MQNNQDFYQVDRLYSFEGKKELEEWLDYCTKHIRVNYYSKEETDRLVAMSKANDKGRFDTLGLDFRFTDEVYDQYIGTNNANDYMLQHSYAVPTRYKAETLLGTVVRPTCGLKMAMI